MSASEQESSWLLSQPAVPPLGSVRNGSATGAKHPQFSTYESRLNSFKNWPVSMPQKPEAMARAGFRYLGTGDHVQCFHCDGGMKNWDAVDDPVMEHVRWFGDCDFMRQELGASQLQQIAERLDTPGEALSNFESLPPPPPSPKTLKPAAEEPMDVDGLLYPTEKGDDHDKLENLLEENEVLKQRFSCKVCLTRQSDILFEPCHHFATCVDCATSVQKCPLCRSAIETFIRINLDW